MNWWSGVLSSAAFALVSLMPGWTAYLGRGVAAPPETIRRTLAWPANQATRRIEVSNIKGPVRIIGEDRTDVLVVATRTVERLGNSVGAEPGLDFQLQDGRLLVCGDASRCGCHLDWRREDARRSEPRTRVQVDFEVHVPRHVTLEVCAIADGDVRVEGTDGRYAIHSVDGDLEMVDVGGSGDMSTVQGDVRASFATAPEQATAFKTVNGDVDVRLPATVSADLRLKTMNGGLYTDFETRVLPNQPTAAERDKGRVIYRMDRYATVRVGRGGPEFTFESLNGDIQIRKR